jgi:BirA family biotin operon repressor/biotin-[acetyl-CoA-carboxylase] ligase
MSSGAATVLQLLRSDGGLALSGQVLSEQLHVSRAQVWKHVQSLRSRGYTIEGEAGEGYRLTGVPDRLYPEELQAGLQSRWIGGEIEYFDTIDSTNHRASERARAGVAAGTAIVAEGQTAGRGRLGRSFFSPPHLNLYTSIVLRPTLTTAEAPTLILTAAVAVADSIAEIADDADAVEIKWPNDVLLGGRKTSGILMELSAEATRVDYAVLGIGVNLNVERESFPDEFRDLATSLRSHTGHCVDRLEFTRRLFEKLESALDTHAAEGFGSVRPRFESYFRMVGRSVTVQSGTSPDLTGSVLGITADGALELEAADGATLRVIAGDVTLAKERATH